ncbi:MAG: M20/M25/M40 family metallo-hydrolase [Acidobacteriota bacterium]|nr:M20/M25/M40 family metallo-hydrolase [Acidobacteriota bacterium]
MKKNPILILVLGLVCVGAAAGLGASRASAQKPLPSDIAKALAVIDGASAYAHVKTMADPAFAGRMTGHEGYTAAARWAAGLFRAWGLKPVSAKDGYLLPYPSPYTVVRSAEMTVSLPGDAAGRKLAPNSDFLPLIFTDSGKIEAGLVFAGWGISAPELGYDDYAGLDVKGKMVLCFRGTPARDDRYNHHDEHRTRMQTAQEKGAAGLIYIYPEPLSNPNGDWRRGFLPAMISEKVADSLLKEIGVTSAELKKDLLTYRKPLSSALKSRIRYEVEAENHPDGIGYNVAGCVEGSDPVLKKECLVVGGHFDHDGLHMGFLFPGADDNASGSATVMEIARAFAALKQKPKRSVVFVLFGGEEKGLQGSTWFVGHVPALFAKVDAMLNFDMTGEGDGAWGGYTDDALKPFLDEADSHVGIIRGLSKMSGPAGVRGSDFAPFYAAGIATASIGSNGPHLAYHLIGDTIYRINPDIMADIARVAFLAGRAWADR